MPAKLGKNPWIYILISPKQVVRSLCNYEPRKGLFILSAITALHYFFLYMAFHSFYMAHHLFLFLPLLLILSPLIGWVWIHFQSWAVLVTGKILKGKACKKEVLVAIAWSKLPLAITLFLWVVLMTFSPHPFYQHYYAGFSLVLIGLISMISFIWSIALYIQGIQEVQRFSFILSLVNILTAFVLMSFTVMLFCFLYYYVLRLFV